MNQSTFVKILNTSWENAAFRQMQNQEEAALQRVWKLIPFCSPSPVPAQHDTITRNSQFPASPAGQKENTWNFCPMFWLVWGLRDWFVSHDPQHGWKLMAWFGCWLEATENEAVQQCIRVAGSVQIFRQARGARVQSSVIGIETAPEKQRRSS